MNAERIQEKGVMGKGGGGGGGSGSRNILVTALTSMPVKWLQGSAS